MRLCILVSGGKDSVYTLHRAIWEKHEVECIVVFHSMRDDSWIFHTPATRLVSLQAEALNMKDRLVEFTVSGSKSSELAELENALTEVARNYKIEGVGVGVISSWFQRERIGLLASKLGLHLYTPLWGVNQEEYLARLVEEGFKIIIVKASTMGINSKLVGVPLEQKHVKEIISLARRYGFNPAFEGGEAETLVLDAPLFNERICIEGRVVRESLDVYRLDIRKAWLEPRGGSPCISINWSS